LKKFKITIGDKNYEITAERDTADPSLLSLTVDGKIHNVQIEEEEAPKSSPGPRPAAPSRHGSSASGSIVAQIPGTVLAVNVSVRDSVNVGDKLMVLEAMKMENVITAGASGSVQAVHVTVSDKVVAGQLMMEIA
jgi:biotin carboxyl carrier protein